MVYKQTIKDDKGMDSPLTAELVAGYHGLPVTSIFIPCLLFASRLIPTLVLWCMQSFSDELMMVKNQQRRTETGRVEMRWCIGAREFLYGWCYLAFETLYVLVWLHIYVNIYILLFVFVSIYIWYMYMYYHYYVYILPCCILSVLARV